MSQISTAPQYVFRVFTTYALLKIITQSSLQQELMENSVATLVNKNLILLSFQTNKLAVVSSEWNESYLQGSRPLPQQLFNVPGCSGHQLLCVVLLHSVEVLVSQKNLDRHGE